MAVGWPQSQELTANWDLRQLALSMFQEGSPNAKRTMTWGPTSQAHFNSEKTGVGGVGFSPSLS